MSKPKKEKVTKPEPLQFFQGDSVANWTTFKKQWDDFQDASGLSQMSSTDRVVTFLRVVGKDAINAYNSFSWGKEADARNIDRVIEKFEGLCLSDKSTRFQRYLFYKREQEVGETFDDYVAAVELLASSCNFGAAKETLLTDKIVFGMRDRAVREEMLMSEETLCEKVLELIKTKHIEIEKKLAESTEKDSEHGDKMADELVILDEINEDEEANYDANENGAEEKADADDELIIKADADFEIEEIHDEEAGGKEEKTNEGEEEKPGVYQSKRDSEFTSEDFKIEINGLPKYYGVGQLKKLLNETLQLKAHKVKPASSQHMDRAYVTFRDQKARDKSLAVLEEFKWKGCVLSAKVAEAVEDPILKVADLPSDIIVDPTDKTPVNVKVVKSVTPLAHLSYEEQLEQKQKAAYAVLRKLGSEMSKTNPELEDFVRFHKLRRKGQICEVGEILRSPVTDGYRNKCEFTVGTNPETELPTVGFRVSSYKAGSVAVAPVAHLCHISDTMKKVVEVFEQFVRSSEHKPYDPITHDGVWRQLTVRTSSHNDILIAVIVHPQEFTEEQMGDIKQSVLDYFTDGSGSSVGITSIFFQAIGQREPNPEDPHFDHLWGKEYITETVLDKTFQVSCESFFQINTKACEVLYETVGELAELDGTSAILDICCGTGTIGISLADQCLRVYGIEMVKKAAEDARKNAELNELENVAIYAGKVEVNLAAVLSQAAKYSAVGVIDPPRAGLSEGVIRSLRRCENLNRLIYMSCDPEAAFKNFIDLSRPKSKNYKGEFFIPIKAAIVDMFPHTPHYELLIVFERWEERKWRRIMEGVPLPRDEEYFKRIPAKPDYAYEMDKDEQSTKNKRGRRPWYHMAKRKKTTK